MTDLRFEKAVRAASAKKPPGMGDFAVREMVRAVLDAIDAPHSLDDIPATLPRDGRLRPIADEK